jgi:hypothetical protein
MQATGLVNDHVEIAGKFPTLKRDTNTTTFKPTLNFQTKTLHLFHTFSVYNFVG